MKTNGSKTKKQMNEMDCEESGGLKLHHESHRDALRFPTGVSLHKDNEQEAGFTLRTDVSELPCS